jgi:ketosteroid isomerase-like protein
MLILMKSQLLVLMSCLALHALSQAQTAQSGENDITSLVERYDAAWNHKDVAAIKRILAADYVYFTSKGGVQSRQHVLDMASSPKYMLASAERNEMKIYRMADTAVVGSRWKGHGSYDGQPFNDDQRCSIVLGRENREWKILSEHCTQITGP